MGLTGNQVQRYSKGAIFLHWAIALLLAAEIAIGFTMPKDASGFMLFQLHKSLGITILLLTALRIIWRMTHKRPPAIEGGFNGILASAVHVLFYLFMILAPLTGWAVVSSASIEVPTLLFGIMPWPHLPIPQSMNELFEETHEILAFLGLALFLLHVAGALRHHFLKGDKLLARMAPGGQPFATLFLGALVIALGAAVFFAIGPREGEHDHAVDHGQETGLEAHSGEGVGVDVDGESEPGDSLAEPLADDADAMHDDVAHEHDEEESVEAAAEGLGLAEEEAPAPEAVGPPPSWSIQPGGSLRFAVSNGDTRLNGSFASWGGDIVFDPDNPQSADITITIQLGSASLGDATQDQMLRGADFFSAAAFPTATWRSASVTSMGGGQYRANGTLSLKGVSQPQSLTFTLTGSGNARAVSGEAVIDRSAFGVGTGDSAAGVGSRVSLDFSFNATR